MRKWLHSSAWMAIVGCHAASAPSSPRSAPHASPRAQSLLQADPSALAVRMYDVPTPQADAHELASMLATLFPGEQGAASGVFRIQANERGDTLHVEATEAGALRVRALLFRGPCDPPSQRQVLVLPLVHLDAMRVAGRAQVIAGVGPLVVADVPTNSLVLSAPLDWDPSGLRAWVDAHDR